ncbi:MAG: amino acid adenylation domain-containing protein [Pseudobutyrivibrio sp.]|uniref:non-ribosomal peptide synthetase n=1 Tax=Pseudobutyrivibrio sp. TaxID=2014367 RepID=UPI0025EE609F|nr:non-ribosomal peptide synthetase [Pseudobutyrivibrio sp.]MBE5903195.1 amino acid adenylation domain-containing protein [Pseudobutyrivibrio sp.]
MDLTNILEEIGVDPNISDEQNLVQLGVSSIQLMKVAAMLRKSGCKITFVDMISQPTYGDLKRFIETHQSEEKEEQSMNTISHDMHEPFPMTEVQNAYWIGRMSGQSIGSVGCHGYMEIDVENIDVERLNKAFYNLQMHHPMLRVIITQDGQQYICDHPYRDNITVYDYRTKDATDHLKRMREETSHRLLDIYHGQIIALQLTLLPDNKARIHYDVDLLIADVTSFQIILRDLVALYNGRSLPDNSKNFNFAEYILNEREINKAAIEKDEKYWKERIMSLPGKPELPVNNTEIEKPVFERREAFLEPELWAKFKETCAYHKITPARALLTLYAMVVARYSINSEFLINLPLFNRSIDTEGMENAVADFTTLLLIAYKETEGESFLDKVLKVDKEFKENMEHIHYSGVSIERDYLKLHPGEDIVAPIVFSCNLGVPLLNEEFCETFGDISYMISQTPQVWLDFQLFDIHDGFLMIWDSVKGIFEENVLDEMFAMYQRSLRKLALMDNFDSKIELDIDEQLAVRNSLIQEKPVEKICIHEGFFAKALEQPEKVALIDVDGKTVTYGQLADLAYGIRYELLKNGVRQNECVGICMPRGKRQIASIMGILAAGCTYVTIGYGQPEKRRLSIIERSEISKVVVNNETEERFKGICTTVNTDNAIMDAPKELSKVDPEQIAYIIFTSGSSGEPKGVMIPHFAAWNTISNINKQYNVNSIDTALQVSQIDFDLSVYDIFGLLSAGGKLVLVPQGKETDGEVLYRLVTKYGVTIYNSVPALLELGMIFAEENKKDLGDLRLALCSGDWIPLDLPERFYNLTKESAFISLGGATEASIWSNYYQVSMPLPDHFKSIPYGYPLCNQKYRVMNDRQEDCPDYVAGELWIGGVGVAAGYKGNEEETKNHFVNFNNEIWYRTGDYGRFWKDGIIEFLGRKDNQVKIRGHRIELEEIEKAYMTRSDLKQAIVLPIGDTKAEYLAAFLVPEKVDEKETVSYHADWNSYIVNQPLDKEDATLIDNLTIYEMGSVLKELGIPTEKDAEYSLKDMSFGAYGRNMLILWYTYLKEQGYVSFDENVIEDSIRNIKAIESASNNLKESKFYNFAERFVQHGANLIKGRETVAEAFFMEDKLDLHSFIQSQPGAKEKYDFLNRVIKDSSIVNTDSKILLLTGAYGEELEELLTACNQASAITISNFSIDSLEEIKSRIINGNNISFNRINEAELVSNVKREEYDLIVSLDFIHRFHNIPMILKALKEMLCTGGKLIFTEVTENESIELVTTAYLEDGFGGFTDNRKDNLRPLLSVGQWMDNLSLAGFAFLEKYNPHAQLDSQAVFFADKGGKNHATIEEFENYITDMVPHYMVPKQTIILSEIPYTANGKINRRALKDYVKQTATTEVKTLPSSKIAKDLAEIWARVLHVDEVFMEDDFYLLGGDSLIATRIKSICNKELQINVALEDIFKNSVFGKFANYIENKTDNSSVEDYGVIEPDEKSKFKVFPLTDVQNAYWIGRMGGYDFSDVSSHCYFEMDAKAIDTKKLEETWNQLINVHDMMRAVILSDGSGQQILESVPFYKIECYKGKNDIDKESHILETRRSMSEKVYDSSQWPLFEIQVTYYGDRMRVHTSFDNIVFDGFSIFKLFEQWNDLVNGKTIEYSNSLSFRDYVLKEQSLKNTKQYASDVKYWEKKVETLFDAPALPISNVNNDGKSNFTRFQTILEADQWQKIEALAKKLQLTMPIFFMGAYAEILACYSASKQFTINLTRFQKLPLHPEVEKIIGDFTTLTLLEIDFSDTKNFYERCKRIEEQLYKDMEHNLVSGVEVERMLAKKTGKSEVTMPFVFTSGFGINKENAYFGDIVYGQSQTPQVFLDQQISIQNGKLHLSWDAVLSVFPDNLIEDMFDEYLRLLSKISDEDIVMKYSSNLVESKRVYEIEEKQNCRGNFVSRTMLDGYRESCKRYGDLYAIIGTVEKMTYKELDVASDKLAKRILSLGVTPKSGVAISMEKGVMQVVAAVAVLKAGCFYVPIDIHNPQGRIESIKRQANVEYDITEAFVRESISSTTNENINIQLPVVNPQDVAYVIFTSGSTGVPKGVVITHEAAMNTIDDINDRFDVTEKDGSIFLSNLNFDLSVYDIFGMLSIGGHVVVPDADKTKDPNHWQKLLKENKVTVWNTVPTFMQMMVEQKSMVEESSLRLVLLSGDWIPTRLPAEIYEHFGVDVKLVSLGGATEASIWSNYFEIPKVIPEEWESIPYGKPLSNQGFIILDSDRKRVPVNVPGELYIIGKGVAAGYINDPEKTNSAFIEIPNIVGKAYRTGDYGRYLPDGTIIFCGRKDHQIKRGGHRIELGEIENQISDLDGIKQAVVTFEVGKDSSLTAHLITEDFTVPYLNVWKRDVELPTRLVEPENPKKFKSFQEDMENVVKKAIVADFMKWGILEYLNESKTIGDILRKFGINEKYDGHIRHLLDFMVAYGILENNNNLYRIYDDYKNTVSSILNQEIPSPLNKLEERLAKAADYRLGILKGTIDTRNLILNREENFLYPDELNEYSIEERTFEQFIRLFLEEYKDNLLEGIVYEIASRTENHTNSYRECLNESQRFIYLDESAEMIARKREQISDLDAAIYRMDESIQENKLEAHKASLIIAENTLHRSKNVINALNNLKDLLIPGGMVLICENTKNVPLLFETVAYLEGGYSDFTDMRSTTKQPLLSADEWEKVAKDCGFENVFRLLTPEEECNYGKNVFILTAQRKVAVVNEVETRAILRKYLPEYMIPNHYILYTNFPVSQNGKIDRKTLAKKYEKLAAKETVELPETELEKEIAKAWEELLQVENVGRNNTFFELGGDSLTAIRFINSFSSKKITLQMLTAHPTLADLAYVLENEQTEEDEVVWEEEEEIF